MTRLRPYVPLICLLVIGVVGCKGGSQPDTAKAGSDKTAQSISPEDSAQQDSSSAAQSQNPGSPPGSPNAVPGGPPGAPGAPAAPASPATPITPSGPPTEVVAKVNGQAITRAELDFMVKNVMKEKAASVPTDRHAEIRRRVLDDMINKELLYQKAKGSNVSVTPAEVSETVTKIKSDWPDPKAFDEQLRKDGMTMSGIEAMIRQGMVIDKFLTTSVKPTVKVLPADEDKFYAKNKEMMKHPEQLRASHILLRIGQGAPEDIKKAQKTKAEEILTRAKKGEDFAALAKQYSQDPQTAPNGGDLGFFPQGQMVPAFDAAAWALKPGEISGIVETNFGLHIIKAVERRPQGYAPIDAVRAKIHEYLVNQHVQQSAQKTIGDLRAQAKIDVML